MRGGADRRRAAPPAADPPGLAPRRAAAALVEGVLADGRRLAHQIADPAGPLAALEPAQRARAQALAGALLRHLPALDAVLGRFVRRSPPGRALTALRLVAAEVLVLGGAPHAAVDAAVRLAREEAGSRGAAGFVNAVARRVAADGPGLWARREAPALPPWLAGPVATAWGAAAAAAIAAAHGLPPPLDLTLRRQEDAPLWAGRLGAEILPTGSLRLSAPGQVSALPGYAEGAWWVQDAAAALPVRLAGALAGRRALDLCAAPGGKTLQLAAAGAEVTALDISAARAARLADNLGRTGLAAATVIADARTWTPERRFDVVLLDAPCSATGTIRRHPDLPHLAGGIDAGPLIALQAELLDRAFGFVAPGGRLVYATCSLLPAEGEDQVAAFLARTPRARLVPATGLPSELVDGSGALRTRPDLWPERGGLDGFHAAAIEAVGP